MNTNINLNNTNPVHIYKVTCQVCTNGIFTARMIWVNFDETALAAVTDTAERYAFKHGYTVVGINEIGAAEAQSLINRGMSYSPIDEQAERDHDPSFATEDTEPAEAALDDAAEDEAVTLSEYCEMLTAAENGESITDPDPAEVDEAVADAVAHEVALGIISTATDAITAEAERGRSAWRRGVAQYALDLLDTVTDAISGGWADPEDIHSARLLERVMLNGADSWSQYSWGGCALCYDGQIAERLCTPSELERTHNGQRRPNCREEWLDVQTRALFQAAALVKGAIRRAADGESVRG